eukprot:2607762-Amphidinium_carterae.1
MHILGHAVEKNATNPQALQAWDTMRKDKQTMIFRYDYTNVSFPFENLGVGALVRRAMVVVLMLGLTKRRTYASKTLDT